MLRKISISIIIILLSVVSSAFAKYNADDLIEVMKKNNLSINEDKLALKEIENSIAISKAQFFPKITYGINSIYIANPVKEISVPVDEVLGKLNWPDDINPPTTGEYITIYNGMESSFYSFGIGLIQPIATWGKLTAQLNITNAMKEIHAQKSALNIITKSAQIKVTMQSLYYLDKMLLLYNNSRLNSEELAYLVNEVEKSGMSIGKQTLEAKVSTFAFRYAVDKAMSETDKQLQSLRELTGIDDLSIEDLEFEPKEMDDYAQIINMGELNMISKATGSNKEAIKIADLNISVAEEKERIAKAGVFYKPDVFLFATVTYSGSRFPFIDHGWFTNDRYNGFVGLRVAGTLYDGGSQFHRIKADALGVEKTELQKKNAVNKIGQTIKSLKNEIQVTISAINHKNAIVSQKNESYRVANEEYGVGTISKIDFLKADIEKTMAEADVYTEYIKLAVSYYILSSMI